MMLERIQRSLVCGLPAPWKLLPSPKEALIEVKVEFSCATVKKSLKEAVAYPTWVQQQHGMC